MRLAFKIILGIILVVYCCFCGWLATAEIKDRDWTRLIFTVLFTLIAILDLVIVIFA